MTNQEILEKAIQKAIDGGFNKNDMGQKIESVADVYYYFGDDHGDLAINNLIWRHDFAKALWGEKRQCLTCGSTTYTSRGKAGICMGCDSGNDGKAWQYHLQMMVISDDPIQYLGEHLDG